MKQIWITRHGGPEALEIREAELPGPGADELTIAVKAAGFNFADWTDAGPDAVRLVAAFNTDPAHVDALISTAGRLLAAAA